MTIQPQVIDTILGALGSFLVGVGQGRAASLVTGLAPAVVEATRGAGGQAMAPAVIVTSIIGTAGFELSHAGLTVAADLVTAAAPLIQLALAHLLRQTLEGEELTGTVDFVG